MFTEILQVDLTLTIDSQTYTIPGGHIQYFALDLQSHGFHAEVTFWSPSLYRNKDELFDSFKSLDLITASLSIQAVYNMPDPAPAPIKVTGLVTRKSVTEMGYGQISSTVSHLRRYHIEIVDTARVLWSQHYPCDLLTESTIQNLIEQHTPTGLSIEYDWDALTASHPMLCLGLNADTSPASFYDFLLWYVRTNNGVFSYDGVNDTYSLSAAKNREGTASALSAVEIDELEVVIPETIRHSAAVLNANAANSDNQAIDNDQAVTGVRRDMLMRTPVPADVDSRVTLETARLVTRQPTLALRFNTYPTIAIQPGAAISFDQTAWNAHTSWLSGDYWAFALSIRGDAVDSASQTDLDQAHTAYQIELTLQLESADDSHIVLPRFTQPVYPLLVEGTIVSSSGGDDDKTYQLDDDETTSLPMHTVHIPLWDKEIKAPLLPGGMPGHFYFPAFKNQRVLVALDFQAATIARFLDFGARTILTTDSQGNHILFGQNETSETSMRYAYEDDKSLFEVKRVMGGDNVLLRIVISTIPYHRTSPGSSEVFPAPPLPCPTLFYPAVAASNLGATRRAHRPRARCW